MNRSLEQQLKEAQDENRRLREALSLVASEVISFSGNGTLERVALGSSLIQPQVISAEVSSALTSVINASLASQNEVETVLQYQSNDGHELSYRVRGRPIFAGEHSATKWIGCLQDVTSTSASHANHREQREHLIASQERLSIALQASGMCVFDTDLRTKKATWTENAEEILGVDLGVNIAEVFARIVDPIDIDRVAEAYRISITNGKPLHCEARVNDRYGEKRWISITGTPYYSDQGVPIRMIGALRDVSERHRSEEWLNSQKRVLELISTGVSLPTILSAITEMIEAGMPACIATLMTTDNQKHLNFVAGARLPAAFASLTKRVPIGPNIGSCGTAAHTGQVVITHDIENDSKWCGFADAALKDGLRSCWSFPIIASEKLAYALQEQNDAPKVLGTFGVYHSYCCSPTESELKLIQEAVHLASIALENDRVEQTLLQSERSFRDLANAMPQLVWTTDAYGKCNFSNRLLCETIGDGLTMNWHNVVHPDDRDEALRRHLHSLESGQNYTMEHRLRVLSTGQYRWFLARAIPSKDEDGMIQAWYGTATDIDDLKRAEEALREERDRLSAIAEASPSALFSIVGLQDGSSYFAYAAPSIADMFDVHLEDLGKDGSYLFQKIEPSDLAELRDVFTRLGVAVMMGEEKCPTIHHEFRVNHPTHGTRWIECVAAPRLLDSHAICWHGIMTDITHRRMLEEKLFQSEKLEAIVTLAGGIAHDFNNLLTVVLGSCQLLELQLRDRVDELTNVEAIKHASQRAANLTKQMLTFSRQQKVTPQNVNLSELIYGAKLVFERLVTPIASLQFDLSPALDNVFADPTQLEQILINLIVNSRDAVGSNGQISISTRNRVIVTEGEYSTDSETYADFVELSVRDNGHGMTDEVRSKMFDPYFSTKPFGKGTGLGLAVVHGIVVQNKGYVEVDSEPNAGTEIRIFLPSVRQAKTAATFEAPLTETASNPSRILVVDDEVAICEIASRSLQSAGYQVEFASSVQSAVELFHKQQGQFDLLLADIGLPDGNGFDLARDFVSLQPELKLVFMSGVAVQSDSPAPDLSYAVFLPKPFMPLELNQAVRSVLEQDRI